MTKLSIGWNDIGSKGAKAIAAGMKNVTMLFIYQNQIDDEAEQMLRDRFKDIDLRL